MDVDLNGLPFPKLLDLFLDMYSLAKGEQLDIKDLEIYTLSSHKTMLTSINEIDLCTDIMLFRLYYFFTECIDDNVIENSNHSKFLKEAKKRFLIDINAELNKRIEYKKTQVKGRSLRYKK